jgi:hypothetical protein
MDGAVDKVHEEDDGEASQRRLRDVVVWYSFYGTTFGAKVHAKPFGNLRGIGPYSIPRELEPALEEIKRRFISVLVCQVFMPSNYLGNRKLRRDNSGRFDVHWLVEPAKTCCKCASDETQGSKLESGDGKSLSCATSVHSERTS